ncbi:HWE histidine kinase domain-containing protein [Roseomonas sp. HF4]|uniref:HWE histidine kinase domain-containing protein n=1 Tax=Roseomonas sp. HF4 TaxID=2562313 RepID=UPI0010C05C63|nr:HWE histidine kinase domain-containing protein [Roseomonas sp. HF4]
MDQQAPSVTDLLPLTTDDAVRPQAGWRLSALLVGAILLPAMILGAACMGAWHAAWKEADRELAVAVEAASEFALRVVEGHGRLAARIADTLAGEDDASLGDAAGPLRDGLLRFVADLPLVAGVVVTGQDGRALVHADLGAGGSGAAPDLAGTDLAPAGQGILLGGAFRPGIDAPPVFAVAASRGDQRGVVAILLDSARTGQALRRVLGNDGDSAALIRTDGTVMARYPPLQRPAPRLGPEQPLIAALAAGASSGRLDGETPRDGQPVILRFRRLEGHPSISITAARPRAEVVARWQAAVLPMLAIGLPAILVLGGLAWLVRGKQQALETAMDGLEQRVADRTASLREGEERLRLAVAAGRFGTWETDLGTGLTTWSPRALSIFGLTPDRRVTAVEEWGARIHPDERVRVLEAWDRTVSGRAPAYREEYRFRREDGAWRWLESSAAVVRSDAATGRPLRIAGTLRDITERREAEERRDLLMREVNHRARNTLAIVQAILRLTRATDPATYARLVEGRIAALARAQALLAAERWTGAPLMTVLREELAPFGAADDTAEDGRGRFVLSGPALRLQAETVQPLAMVFHELATNAAKHGALRRPDGRLEVQWHVEEAAGLLRIRWTERGGPAPGLPKHRGVGSRVIEATIAGQLGGSIERRWPDEGLVCDIAVPLARIRPGQG